LRDVDDAPKLDETEIGRIFREESGRSVASLIRLFGDIDVAEDAVQEAFAAQPGRLDHNDRPQPCYRPPAPRVAWTGTAQRRVGALARQ